MEYRPIFSEKNLGFLNFRFPTDQSECANIEPTIDNNFGDWEEYQQRRKCRGISQDEKGYYM